MAPAAVSTVNVNTARAVANMFSNPCTRPAPPELSVAAYRTQRPLRVDESESGVEIESLRIIDALRPDVASEIAQLHVVGGQAKRPVDGLGRQISRANEALTRVDVPLPLVQHE